VRGHRVAAFLDYDGTLAPIAPRPELATLPAATRHALAALARACPVALISGRDRADVMRLVDLEGLFYVGSHGLDIEAPDGTAIHGDMARPFISDLAAATGALRREAAAIAGVLIEEKAFAVAVHYRLVDTQDVPSVRAAVERVAARFPRLRVTGGKKVLELRPRVDWHKGTAVLALLDALSPDARGLMPIYIGDDETDEDAFAAIKGRGLGVLVSTAPAPATRADYRLRDPGEVRQFIEALTEMVRAAPGSE